MYVFIYTYYDLRPIKIQYIEIPDYHTPLRIGDIEYFHNYRNTNKQRRKNIEKE